MNKFKENRFLQIVTHMLVWLVLFCIPYIVSSGENFRADFFIEHSIIPLGLSAVLFYINYFVLVDRFLFKKQRIVYFVVNAVLIALFVWVRHSAREHFYVPGEGPKEKPPVLFFIYFDTLSFLIPLIIVVSLKVFQQWLRAEAEKKENENIRLQAELAHLKYQLQPHFFFNSLNNIYALVDFSPEKAKVTILALSTLMRYLLYESNTEKVSLDKEIEFLKKYIELMQLRTADNTTVTTNFSTISANVMIAPLLLIPLIENAFKHGISATENNQIAIKMEYDNNSLFFEIENSNHPVTKDDRSGSGIGLQNVKKRLELLYPGSHVFSTRVDGNNFISQLELQL